MEEVKRETAEFMKVRAVWQCATAAGRNRPGVLALVQVAPSNGKAQLSCSLYKNKKRSDMRRTAGPKERNHS
jgi:hypothetical protein